MCGKGHSHATTQVWRWEDNFEGPFSPSTVLAAGTQAGSSGLAAGAFTLWACHKKDFKTSFLTKEEVCSLEDENESFQSLKSSRRAGIGALWALLTTSPHQITLTATVIFLAWSEVRKRLASSVHRTQTWNLLAKCTNIHFLIKEWFYFKMKDTAPCCLSTQEVEAEDRAQSQALVLTDFNQREPRGTLSKRNLPKRKSHTYF